MYGNVDYLVPPARTGLCLEIYSDVSVSTVCARLPAVFAPSFKVQFVRKPPIIWNSVIAV